jgi:F-type H+-transporting ATPase subunit gamma
MATLREIKRRIDSVKSTQQITKAMKMVAAAKLRKAQDELSANRPYSDRAFEMIGTLAQQKAAKEHPFFVRRSRKKILCVFVSADRGLCGSFNSNLIRVAEHEMKRLHDRKAHLITIGKKGYDHFRRLEDSRLVGKYVDFFNKLHFNDAVKITNELIAQYEKGRFDSICVIYNDFKSIAQQEIIVKQFLPIIPVVNKDEAEPVATVFEPNPEKMLDELLRSTLQLSMYRILLESFTAEQSARMNAMETASENANEMINTLVLFYNKARQAAITTELNEIVSGAEALKG